MTSTADRGAGSLRQAVAYVCPGGTITFDASISGETITLDDQIMINKDLTIVGPGAQNLTISGGRFDEDNFDIDEGGVFYLKGNYIVGGGVEPISVSMSGVTIKDGRALYGGGIFNGYNSTLALNDCVIGPNNIVTEAGGGIVNKGGEITLNRCTVVGNHGTGSIGGAGIFSSNSGSITLINSTVTENVTNNLGGGILVWHGGTVDLIHSTISGNTANNDYDEYPWGGGGGIYVVEQDENYYYSGGTINILNSIVAGNIDKSEPATSNYAMDVYGTVDSLGGNLIGDGTGSSGWVGTDMVGDDDFPIDPMLDKLALNPPGTTPTFALLAGSPAIDAVACPEGIDEDQRGVERPQGDLCDIGAYELEQAPVTGALKISKAFDPQTSGFTGTFAIHYNCDDGTAHDGTVNLAGGESQTITGIPTGTQCTVTEPTTPTAPTGWSFGTPTYSPTSGTVTISEVTPAYAEVIVTNTISQDTPEVGELRINKVFVPGGSGFTGTFAIAYDCDDGTAHDGTVNLAGGGSKTITGIPTGTQCTVTEPTLPGAPTGWSFGEPMFNPASGTVTIGTTKAEVTVTNNISRDLGELKISKAFDPGESGFTGDFTIHYDCGTAHHGNVVLAAGGSQTITGIPTGTQCTVTEPTTPTAPTGWSFGTPTFSPTSGKVTIGISPAEVTITNTISPTNQFLFLPLILFGNSGQ